MILLFAAIRVVVVRMRMVMRVRMDVVYIEVHMFDVAIYQRRPMKNTRIGQGTLACPTAIQVRALCPYRPTTLLSL